MTATSQKFDTLDGLVVTGSMEVGGNLAVDTNVLFVDTVNNRVGINDSTPSQPLDVTGNIRTSSGLFVGGDIIHDGDTDTKIEFTTNQIALEAGGLLNTLVLDNTKVNIANGQGLWVRGVDATPSDFQTNSNKATGAVGANFIYTSFIEASGEKGTGSTGIAIGQIDNTGTSNWANNAADQIKIILSGDDQYHFTTTQADFNNNDLIGVNDVAIANSIFHTGDTNTYLRFNGNDSFEIRTNNSQRFLANNSGVYVTGILDVSTDITARRIRAEDYFKETVVAASTGNAVTINVNSGSVYTFTPNANYSVDFTNFPTGSTEAAAFTLVVNNNGTAREATWPSSGEGDKIYWAESVEPPASAGIDIYNFVVIANQIYGSLSIRNAGFAN